jgi:hypothetical protein
LEISRVVVAGVEVEPGVFLDRALSVTLDFELVDALSGLNRGVHARLMVYSRARDW